ncbi:hypothetical protein [Chryseobacterium luteum]|uniref:DUF4347 domain-containing protein n=1 Tax=Chryseobacterium luteum TaxID=421531 RepID=A0A085YY28_9FLAO|nr:hypothetical protein [Chryseobacterium luteum]KFE97091.1 hypothetical protein IX38_21440 [Chryseobacterium luteum]
MERTLTVKKIGDKNFDIVLNASSYRHPHIILNFLRSESAGAYVNQEFEDNGWKVIDVTNLETAKTKLYNYLDGNEAETIYLNSHGGATVKIQDGNFKLDDEGNYIPNLKTKKPDDYLRETNSGAHLGPTDNDWVMSYHLEYYNHEKKKKRLKEVQIKNIELLVAIAKKVKAGKNLVFGSCNTGMDDRFGKHLVQIIPNTIDIFMNNNLTSSITTGGKITFDNFTKYAQTSAGTLGWDRFKKGSSKKLYKNLIINKYGVKVVQ